MAGSSVAVGAPGHPGLPAHRGTAAAALGGTAGPMSARILQAVVSSHAKNAHGKVHLKEPAAETTLCNNQWYNDAGWVVTAQAAECSYCITGRLASDVLLAPDAPLPVQGGAGLPTAQRGPGGIWRTTCCGIA